MAMTINHGLFLSLIDKKVKMNVDIHSNMFFFTCTKFSLLT